MGIDIYTIKKALTYSDKIVHVGTYQLFHYLQNALDVMKIDRNCLHFCELDLNRTVEEQTEAALKQGYEVVIGGYDAVSQARLHNKIGIEINVDNINIESVIFNAQSIIIRMLEKEESAEFENAIFQSTLEGIIVTDRNHNIIKLNNAAKEIMGSHPKGTSLKSAFDSENIVEFSSADISQLSPNSKYTPVFLKKSPVAVNNDVKGYVLTIKPLSDINEHQNATRSELQLKGMVALTTFSDIIGSGSSITALKEQAAIYSQYDSPLLISGETGTGKELFAQSIHNASKRKLNPWVSINCATLSETLIESELFGYEKGAFTGAKKEGKLGFFELANGGTIFLDEISELPITMQSKLLRVLQEGDIIRVGGEKIINVDVRVICSSNKNLSELITQKKFKEDLYYRINVLEIDIPPLRERREDIPELICEFLKKFSRSHEKGNLTILPSVIQRLQALPLSGNVRELSNIIERMVILCPGTVVDENLLKKVVSKRIYASDTAPQISSVNPTATPVSDLHSNEKELILQTLNKYNGSKTNTANALGISRATLWRKLKQYDAD